MWVALLAQTVVCCTNRKAIGQPLVLHEKPKKTLWSKAANSMLCDSEEMGRCFTELMCPRR